MALEHLLFPAARFRHTREPGRPAGVLTRPVRTRRTAWRALTRAIECPDCRTNQAAEKCRKNACQADLSKLTSRLAGLRFHDLRHHAITRLAEACVPDQTLISIAGHVSCEMLEHYSHIRPQARREAVARLDAPRRPEHGSGEPEPVVASAEAALSMLN